MIPAMHRCIHRRTGVRMNSQIASPAVYRAEFVEPNNDMMELQNERTRG